MLLFHFDVNRKKTKAMVAASGTVIQAAMRKWSFQEEEGFPAFDLAACLFFPGLRWDRRLAMDHGLVRRRRRALAMTRRVAPVSARMASQRLVWPVKARMRKSAFIAMAKATLN